MSLKLYNTLTRKKETFKPIKKGKVGLFTCGPTVYQFAHIGNLRTYIFEDILKRTLIYNSFKVKHVMNITDVGHLTSDQDTGEDKIEISAKKEKKTAKEIAEFYTKVFKEDIKKLNIIAPNIWCKATEHIKEQINLIKLLEKNNYIYKTEDGIYFDSLKLKDYGKLAKLDIKGLKGGARIDIKGKKHKTDFSLWKFSPKDKKRQMEWSSPWGIGFPGWHIECAAMSIKYLGNPFDIHCGGVDHIPVHHTNEIAQTEAATGKKMANYWLHAEFLLMKEGRMAKSKENFIRLKTLEDEGFSSLDYRYLCLNSHYKSQLTFSWKSLQSAKNALSHLKERINELKKDNKIKNTKNNHKKDFLEAINDDLNTPKALASLWSVIRNSKISNKEKIKLIKDFDKVFALNLLKKEELKIPQEIIKLANEREEARKNKDFQKADELRNQIQNLGYTIEDSKDGFKIKK